jgi:hypothetical protein
MKLPIRQLMIITKNALRFTDKGHIQKSAALYGLAGLTVPPKFSVDIASFRAELW